MRRSRKLFEVVWFSKFVFLFLISSPSSPSSNLKSEFVGSSQCKSCHLEIFRKWESSHHFRSMQIATDQTVLGNFDDQTFVAHDITHKLFRRNNDYFINTLDSEATYQDFKILHTFGFFPLQQYLVEIGDGKLQALNVAWDSRPKERGGQRWFHLHPDEDINPEHPFYWSNHLANWNSRCADCHSTNLDKNFDSASASYSSTFSEVNVSCEACHGPAGEHMNWIENGQLATNTGFNAQKIPPVSWIHHSGDAIARPKGLVTGRELNMCGSCHSRRVQIKEAMPLASFHDHYAIETLGRDLYFADGQIKDEVFVLGSFLQSKMHRAGVTCSNCHDPHSSRIKIEGNGLCSQCHAPKVFDTPSHHRHPINSEGAACVNCHMPARTYMRIDDRRDHSFLVPNPLIAQATDSPDICLGCHQDRTTAWSTSMFRKWGVNSEPEHWAVSHFQARRVNVKSLDDLVMYATDNGIADIVRATLVGNLASFNTSQAMKAAVRSLSDEAALVRRAAVEALRGSPQEVRWRLLSPMLRDESKAVRIDVVRSLVPLIPELSQRRREEMFPYLEEYREFLKLHENTPGGLIERASFELSLENRAAALTNYLQALNIDPNHVPTLVNLADFYRASGLEDRAKFTLSRALKVAPDSAAVNHSYGLFLVRQQRYTEALNYLEQGARLLNSQPRYAYIYAVALDSMGNTETSIDFLYEAIETWPNQFDLLVTLVSYLEKMGRENEIAQPLSLLHSFAANTPEVQLFTRKYPLEKTQ